MADVVPPDPDAMIWSAPQPDRAGRPLLVMMHGHGGVEQDLAELFPALPASLVAVSLRGTVPLRDRWTWYDYPTQPRAAFDAMVRGVLEWTETLPTAVPTGLLGFSQGGAVAVELLRLAPRRFSYAVHLSSFVMPGTSPRDAELAAVRPPVFSGHGTDDDVIPPADPLRDLPWLRRHTTLTERIYEGLGHAISPAVVEDAVRFLDDRLST